MQLAFVRKVLLGFLSTGLLAFSIVGLSNSASATSTAIGTYQLSAGDYYTCAIDTSGIVQCWGKNDSGQLGRGTASSTDENIGPVSNLTNAVAISAGYGPTACAIKSGGTVWCWGEGSGGQLGNGASLDSNVPVQVSGISTATEISVGAESACALLADGTISCWGVNSDGELGQGSMYASSNTPVAIVPADSSLRFKDVEAGPWTACGVTTTGAQYCWGWNRSGQLGTGSATPGSISTPTADAVVTDSRAIGMSEGSICTLHGSNAEVICRGAGYYGEMGNGSHASFNNLTPQYAQTADGTHLSGVIDLAGSIATHCALKSDKTVWCWGNNDSKQRGQAVVDLYVLQVPGITDAVAISGGWQHYCAVLSDASVVCWGRDLDNELGDGLATNSYTPVTVAGLTVKRSTASSPSPTPSNTITPSPSPTPTVRPTLTPTLKQGIATTMKLKKTQTIFGVTKQGAAITVTKSGGCTLTASGTGVRKIYTLKAGTKAGNCKIQITAPAIGRYKAYSKPFTIKMKK